MQCSSNADLIVTDLGGTMVRTDDAILAAVRRAATELGIPDGHPDPVYGVFGTSIWQYIYAWLPDGHKDRTDACHERFWELFPHAVLDQIVVFDGVEEALVELKRRGVRVAVLSGLKIESIERIVATFRFQDWDAVRSSMPLKNAADSRAEGIKRLVEEFGVTPHRTIYIGDTDHDVRQARKAGVRAAVVKTGGQARKYLHKIEAEKPDHLLPSWPDLLGIVTACVVMVGCLMGLAGCASSAGPQARKYLVAPTVLPGVEAEMQTPGFWIGRLAEPDRVILSEEEIRELNDDIRTRLRLTKDIAKFAQEFDGPELRAVLQRELDSFRSRTIYAGDGRKVDASFYASVEESMRLASIASRIQVRFALVVCNADQRLLPIAEGLYAEAGDVDFDEVQNSALDIGTPVAILHASADRRWFYAMGPSSDGWIEAEKLALCSQERLRDMMSRPFVTVVRTKGDIYLDAKLTRHYGFVRMGSKLPLADDSDGDLVAVLLPTRREDGTVQVRTGYLKRRETVAGSLSYTPRHIIEQAFEMLDTPYGWGGANGQQDCSQFVQEVFATVGVHLPRNSSDQARVGPILRCFEPDDSDEDKLEAVLTHPIPGVSLLHTKGHVMLYIGHVSGQPYVIHCVWAYREPGRDADVIRVINRVAVTDLHLGEGSRVGSLLRRLQSARAITLGSQNSDGVDIFCQYRRRLASSSELPTQQL